MQEEWRVRVMRIGSTAQKATKSVRFNEEDVTRKTSVFRRLA